MKGRGRKEITMYMSVFHRFRGQRMKDKSKDGLLCESKGREGECWKRGRGWMYSTRGDDRRICETSLRKYAQLNFPTPMASPLPPPLSRFRPLCEPPALSPACLPASLPACLPLPRPSYVGPHLLVALEFSVRLVASVPCPASIPLFFRRSVLFLSRLSRPCSGPTLSLSSSAITPPCLSSTLALLSRRPCSRAVPLYLPPSPSRRSIIPQSRGV